MIDQITKLATFPAFDVIALPEGHDITLSDDHGYCRTAPIAFALKGFPGERYEWVRGFTIGCDGDDPAHVWAFGNGAMLTAETRAKETRVGIELGDRIQIEGADYIVEAAPNHNISLTRAEVAPA